MDGEWKDDNANTEFEIDLGDLTHISHFVEVKDTLQDVLQRRSKECMEAIRFEIASLENLGSWNFMDLLKERNVIQTK